MKCRSVVLVILGLSMLAGCGGGETEAPKAPRTTPSNTIANEWLKVDSGTYTAGDDAYINFKEKKYSIDAFSIQKYEVTNHQYKTWLDSLSPDEREKHMPKEHFTEIAKWEDGWYPPGLENHPVVNVSYSSARAYADAKGWSLPTRTQWEAAARGPEAKTFPWGDRFDASKANIDNPDGTQPVGSHEAGRSSCGAMDMAGNVWEWTASWFDETNRMKLLKGGSYDQADAELFKCANNLSGDPSDADPTWGFRCIQK